MDRSIRTKEQERRHYFIGFFPDGPSINAYAGVTGGII